MHTVREITPADYSQLEDFLYHAVFVPDGEERPAHEIIFQPEIYVYVKNFGGADDSGVVAEIGGRLAGAAWARIIPAYGNLDDETPELAVSVLPEFRGRGIGTDLMRALFALLRKRGYARTSLSVQRKNPAVRFYQRLGYEIEKPDRTEHDDYIMVKKL
ncbi:MAG: GNAT family N-acetyltransferase [Defluviitaleaceae bacterium]|nr:GNAT family N-acetyltransferase [Defluviitaleaceae bacterium]